MLLLLIIQNVRPEREPMLSIPERLDWLHFLGYDLDGLIPHKSLLTKARARWGVQAFKSFFERIWQCFEAALVDVSKFFTDTSLIGAHASNNSAMDTENFLKRYLLSVYGEHNYDWF